MELGIESAAVMCLVRTCFHVKTSLLRVIFLKEKRLFTSLISYKRNPRFAKLSNFEVE